MPIRRSPIVASLLALTALTAGDCHASQSPQAERLAATIGSAEDRRSIELSGEWKLIVDPFETGEFDYKSRPRRDGFWRDITAEGPEQLVEYGFEQSPSLRVPGDWNTQRDDLFFYEGSVWYRKRLDFEPTGSMRQFIHVAAANRRSRVWLNGEELGSSSVGFTPSSYECTHTILAGENSLVIRVDNRRDPSGVPGIRTDWWNYGGLTRPVSVLEIPETFIRDAHAELSDDRSSVNGWVVLDGENRAGRDLRISIGSLTTVVEADDGGIVSYSIDRDELDLWSPSMPTLHALRVELIGPEGADDVFNDSVGLRTVSTSGDQVLINGEPVLLRGVCVHEEQISGDGRSWSREHAIELAGRLSELGCNFVRLAHYPHAEAVARVMDEAGILVWAEVPVYWTLDYKNPATLEEAKAHLRGLIGRDHNRASIAVWSIGNETGDGADVTAFRRALAEQVRELDPARLLAAALEPSLDFRDGRVVGMTIDDPFGEYVDLLAINSYIGWYVGSLDDLDDLPVRRTWDKPFIVSEFGAGAKRGLASPFPEASRVKWTEAYQAELYERTLAWLESTPGFAGVSPWILSDFRSPRRIRPGVQDWWNRKGLLDEQGAPKAAHETVRRFYERWGAQGLDED